MKRQRNLRIAKTKIHIGEEDEYEYDNHHHSDGHTDVHGNTAEALEEVQA